MWLSGCLWLVVVVSPWGSAGNNFEQGGFIPSSPVKDNDGKPLDHVYDKVEGNPEQSKTGLGLISSSGPIGGRWRPL